MRTIRYQVALALLAVAAGCGGGKGGGGGNPPPPPAGGGARSLSGTVTYDFVPAVRGLGLDFAHAVQKPVRNAVVKVLKGTTVLATTATDAAGHYSVNYTESGTDQLRVAAFSQTTAMPAITVQDNTDGAIWVVGANLDATQTIQDLRATHGWTGTDYAPTTRGAAPFAILDSMYTAASAFVTARPSVVFPALIVNWSPDNVPEGASATCTKAAGCIGTSHFSPSESNGVGQIYVLGKVGADTDEFDTHVIVHEWAHYFEHNLSRSDSPGGPHGSGDILDPRLAFGEGYGNALASMLLPESVYADTLWSSGSMVAGGFDAETEPAPDADSGIHPADDPTPCVFSETSVMRFLYDLFDGGSGETYDQVALGLGPIYDVLTGPQKSTQALTTIGSFITGLKAQAGVDAAAVDALAAHYNIGPITSDLGAGDANLEGMYIPVPTSPELTSCGASCRSHDMVLTDGYDSNKWFQNQYYVFTGTGSTVTITATNATQDVALLVYRSGERIAVADGFTAGTETIAPFTATSGTIYVVSLVGFKGSNTPADYTVALQFQGI